MFQQPMHTWHSGAQQDITLLSVISGSGGLFNCKNNNTLILTGTIIFLPHGPDHDHDSQW